MNKFAARSLVGEAMVMGRTVVVISPRPHETRDALDIVAEEATKHDWPGTRVERRNGGERIDFGIGRITFMHVRNIHRGVEADVVFIDDDAMRRLADAPPQEIRLTREAIAALVESSNGEVVYA